MENATNDSENLSLFGNVKRNYNFLAVLIEKISFLFGSIAAGLMILSAIIIVIEIVTRYFGHPTVWGSDVITYILILFVFLCMPEGLRAGAHINADILVSTMNERMQQLMKAIGLLVGFITLGTISGFALQWAIISIQKGDRFYGALRPYFWPVKLTMAISLIVLSLLALRMLISEFIQVFKNKTSVDFDRGLDNPYLVIPVMIVLIIISTILLKKIPLLGITILLMTLLLAGVPIAYSIMMTALCGLFFCFNGIASLTSTPFLAFNFVNRQTLLALPMFIFAGNIMAKGGLGQSLFDFAKTFVGHIRGGLGLAVTIACTIFGALSGSSPANALTIGAIAYPIMVDNGYDKGISAGLIATAGGIGILIPPSNAAIVYGLLTGESVGTLFIASIVAGILMAVFLAIALLYSVRKHGVGILPKTSWSHRIKVFKKSIWALLMPVVVLGGIYSGIVTITEASAISVIYALLFSLSARTINIKETYRLLVQSLHNVSFLLLILISAMLLTNCITLLQIPNKVLLALGDTKGWIVILVVIVLVIILGCFLNGSTILTLMVPIFAPVVKAFGYNLVWFGVLMIVTTTTASITPPVGMNLFIMQRIADLDIKTVAKGAIPFLIATCILIAIIVFFPEITLWLPGLMK